MALPDPAAVTVLLVDDHEIVRTGLHAVLSRAEIAVVGEAGSVADAVAAVKRLNPGVVLMDVRLPDGSGVEAARRIRSVRPGSKILFLTAFDDDDALLASMSSVADGYLLKEIDAGKLVQAVRAVASGLSVLNSGATRPVFERMRARVGTERPDAGGDRLSSQERRVLVLVAEGKTNKEIGAMLRLSPKTVKNYLSSIFEKLHVTRRSQAAAYFARTPPG